MAFGAGSRNTFKFDYRFTANFDGRMAGRARYLCVCAGGLKCCVFVMVKSFGQPVLFHMAA
ncbi:MAG: hypothetical protein Kow0037_07950 [Calditrichia bacterium]